MTTWAALFERAASHDVGVDDLRSALAARRSDERSDESSDTSGDASNDESSDAGGGERDE